MYCHWRSRYQEDWDPINRFNTATFLCLSHSRTWIFNVIWRGLFCVQWVQIRRLVIVHFDQPHLQGKWTPSWTKRLRPQIRVCETICTCSCWICYTNRLFFHAIIYLFCPLVNMPLHSWHIILIPYQPVFALTA